MDSKNYTQVLIDGKIYMLGGNEDEAYLQKAASYVNDKNAQMRRLPAFTKQSADYQMVMTELNIADDYFKAMEYAGEMERQKNEMEKETYSLKHELVSTQIKLETVLKDLEERHKELERAVRANERLKGELEETKAGLEKTGTELEKYKDYLLQRGEALPTPEPENPPKKKTLTVLESVLGVERLPKKAEDNAEPEPEPPKNPGEGETEGNASASDEAAVSQVNGISDEELAKKALQAARKANSHRGGRR